MGGLVRFCIKRPVFTWAMGLVLMLLGVSSYNKLAVALLPKVDIPIVVVRTVYRGASPNEIEQLVSKPIEDAIADLEGLDKITSYSAEGMSFVVLEMEVQVDVSENDILSIIKGMSAEITASALGKDVINGKVERIEMSSNGKEADGSSSGYAVEVSFDDSKLLLGMNANVKIVLDHKENVLCLPYDAVQKDENDNCYVWKADKTAGNNYKIKKIDIKTGFEADYYTEITSGDLKEGDIVITGTSNVSDGDIVALDTSEE